MANNLAYLLLVAMSTLIEVECKRCYYYDKQNDDLEMYYTCSNYQRCCGVKKCCDTFLSFYIFRLWYFWFGIIFFIMMCSGGGYYYKRRQRVIVNQAPQSTTILSVRQTAAQRRAANAAAAAATAAVDTTMPRMNNSSFVNDTPPAYNQVYVGYPPGPHPVYTPAPPGGIMMTPQGVLYQVTPCGPPPSYDSLHPPSANLTVVEPYGMDSSGSRTDSLANTK